MLIGLISIAWFGVKAQIHVFVINTCRRQPGKQACCTNNFKLLWFCVSAMFIPWEQDELRHASAMTKAVCLTPNVQIKENHLKQVEILWLKLLLNHANMNPHPNEVQSGPHAGRSSANIPPPPEQPPSATLLPSYSPPSLHHYVLSYSPTNGFLLCFKPFVSQRVAQGDAWSASSSSSPFQFQLYLNNKNHWMLKL